MKLLSSITEGLPSMMDSTNGAGEGAGDETALTKFKLGVFWTSYTPAIEGRICRDLLALQHLAKQTRTPFCVAADEVLAPKLKALRISYSGLFLGMSLARVYLAEGEEVPDELYDRLDPDVPAEFISMSPTALEPVKSKPGNYIGIVFPQTTKRIPETLRPDMKAPKYTQGLTPMWDPLL